MLHPEDWFCDGCDLKGMQLDASLPESGCIVIRCLHCRHTITIETDHLPDFGGPHDHHLDVPSPPLPAPREQQP